MDILIILCLTISAVALAFASLLPYAKKEVLKKDLEQHRLSYILIPFLVACFVHQSGLAIATIALLLTLGALIDRNIAYAPDGIVIPLLVLSALMSPALVDHEWWLKLLYALALYGLGEGLWMIQIRVQRTFITPADVLSLAMPFLFFGLTLPYLLFNPILAAIMILMKRSQRIRSFISRPEAVEDAVDDTQMDDGAPALTLLTITYPVYLLLIFWQAMI